MYPSFRQGRKTGLWEPLLTALRDRIRRRDGRESPPRAGIVDSQSVKTTRVGGVRGDAGATQVKRRKRHLVVDTQGLGLRVKGHTAAMLDRAAISLLRDQGHTQFTRLRHLWLDAGDNGRDTGKPWVANRLGWTVARVRHPPKPRGVITLSETEPDCDKRLPPPGFKVLPRR